MMDSFNAHILADEASTGGVVVGAGISATLLLFLSNHCNVCCHTW